MISKKLGSVPSLFVQLGGSSFGAALFTVALALVLSMTLVPATPPAQAQDTPETPRPVSGAPLSTFFEAVDVNLVNLEVYVTEDGRPVEGLGKDDFELLVDGVPQEITNFYAGKEVREDPSEAARAPDAPAAAREAAVETEEATEAPAIPPQQRVNLVVFLDNENISPLNRNKVIAQVRDSLFTELGTADRVVIVSYDGSINVRQFPSADPEVLARALDEMATGSAAGVHSQLDRIDLLRQMQQIGLEGDAQIPGQGFGGGGEADWAGVRSQLRTYAQRQYDRIARTVGTMASFVDSLSGLEGRKALVYVSDGLSLHPGEAIFRAYERTSPPAEYQLNLNEERDYDATPLFERLGRDANASRVTFYTILAAGRGPQTLTPAERPAFVNLDDPTNLGQVWDEGLEAIEKANFRGALQILADATGGRATLAANNFDSAIGDLKQDFDSYYSLGFLADELQGEDHEVEVRVRGGDYDVRHRESFRRKSADQEMESATRSALLFETSENDLGVRVEFGDSQEAKKGRYLLPVIVKFPISKLVLLPGESFHEGKVSIYVAAQAVNGHFSPVQKMPAPVRIPNEELLTAMGQVAGYRMTLLLEPGEHQVAVTVRDELAEVESTSVVDVDAATITAGAATEGP